MATKKDALRHVPLFSAFSSRELARVAAAADRMDAPAGTVLAAEGTPGTRFFVIDGGTVAVRSKGRRVASLGPGEFFGEMALLDGGVRSASVVAETQVSLFVVEAARFDRLLDEVPFLTRQILRGMSNRLRSIQGAPTYVWNRF